MEQIGWSEVAEKIREDDRGKWDRKVPAPQLAIDDFGKLITRNGRPDPDALTLSDLATTQLCERLNVPVAYYRRLPPGADSPYKRAG